MRNILKRFKEKITELFFSKGAEIIREYHKSGNDLSVLFMHAVQSACEYNAISYTKHTSSSGVVYFHFKPLFGERHVSFSYVNKTLQCDLYDREGLLNGVSFTMREPKHKETNFVKGLFSKLEHGEEWFIIMKVEEFLSKNVVYLP
ncbi:MAG: hypothetical protein EOM67_11275 [Spirochaetia bacterium]|nr:hypothetical protein [Spirochaetia bacterium]